MILHVQSARYLGDYTLWLTFSDGAQGEVDLADELEGDVFGPLRDRAAFGRCRVDTELGTVVWDNGADLAPEFLRAQLRPCGQPLPSV